jgi:hypothetical protein
LGQGGLADMQPPCRRGQPAFLDDPTNARIFRISTRLSQQAVRLLRLAARSPPYGGR